MDELLRELKHAYGEEADFREGQREAVQGVLDGKRMLVVQKTGWGKSLVYFLATKIMRKRSKGITLIISPLVVLMDNQIASADRLGLRVEAIHSENTDRWKEIVEGLENDQVDALIVSPERLANENFKKLISTGVLKIFLFVVDEAHCISDWGHDFRPDYRRIVDIIQRLPSNVPVLATTATANDRVVEDIKSQLGEGLQVSRGSLMRESLEIQAMDLRTKEDRLAWILEHIGELPGTGIIYCLTVNDCHLVHKWLSANNIPSECYYADVEKDGLGNKKAIEERFLKNRIKALVATVAFGMGYDKPDIGFVIHFQKPGNLVAYYQQIGRAGRGIDRAPTILLSGEEDEEIHKYFIESAFPTEDLMVEIVGALRAKPDPGLKQADLEQIINMKSTKIAACLKYLTVEGAIEKKDSYYCNMSPGWKPDTDRSKTVTETRWRELEQMDDFVHTRACYMKYIADVLDDVHAAECGRCANCQGHPLISEEVPLDALTKAQQFIKRDFNVIKPRKLWPERTRIPENRLCGEGRVLSNYGDAGWGRIVIEGKYETNPSHFDDRLVEASAELLRGFVAEHDIRWVTSIPSLRRPLLVPDFARRLAEALCLPYEEVIEKVQNTRCQKYLNTSFLQHSNADSSFAVKRPLKETLQGNVLLVDDMVDSGWTFTVCGYKLREQGSGMVYPFALANSAGRGGDA